MSALNVVLSRVLPPRVGTARAGREATAFARQLLGWTLCDAATLFPLVAYVVTADPRLFGVFAVDVLALLTLWPSDARWEAALPPAEPPEERREVVR